MTVTMKVKNRTYEAVRDLAERTGRTMADVLEDAVEAERRRLMIDQTNAGYAAMRANPIIWSEIEAERAVLEGTLADGLEDQ